MELVESSPDASASSEPLDDGEGAGVSTVSGASTSGVPLDVASPAAASTPSSVFGRISDAGAAVLSIPGKTF